jgi:hypothetical protein
MAVPAKEIDTCESVEHFTERLAKSLDHWTNTAKRGIWLEIPSHRPELITVAVGNKFEVIFYPARAHTTHTHDTHTTHTHTHIHTYIHTQFHHAEKGYLMLTRYPSFPCFRLTH